MLKRFEPYLPYPHDYVEPSLLPQPEVITASRQCSNNTHGTASSSGTVACIYHQSNPIYTTTLDSIPHESDNDSEGSSPKSSSSPSFLLNLASAITSLALDKPYTGSIKPPNFVPPTDHIPAIGDAYTGENTPGGKK